MHCSAMKKINVITLGCSKNTVDSEHLMAQLEAAGYTVAADSDRTDAKVVVINTCGFIGDAKQESIDMILRAAAAKQAGRIERLFVVGCLSERYADELRAELPEVDEFFGVKDWAGIARALGAEHRAELETERRLTTPAHYAYLKIGEGCNWKCGYCAIPLIRGPHVSVPMEVLEEEGEKPQALPECAVDLTVAASIPDRYVPDPGQRMDLYRRIARIRTSEDGDDMTDELIDRYGDPPRQVNNLISVALLRGRAAACSITEITQKAGSLTFALDRFQLEAIAALAGQYPGRMLFSPGDKPALTLKLKKGEDPLRSAAQVVERYAALIPAPEG